MGRSRKYYTLENISFRCNHKVEAFVRSGNNTIKTYTYFRENKASRIDFWLTAASLNNQIETVDTQYNPYSDHHGIKLAFRTKETKVGRGLWKMNTANILTQEFKEQFVDNRTNWFRKICKSFFRWG